MRGAERVSQFESCDIFPHLGCRHCKYAVHGELNHGTELENWWISQFAHTFDALAESEARYLARTERADTIRERIAATK
jgi:hypothetical protein